jgi:hypothetical protein
MAEDQDIEWDVTPVPPTPVSAYNAQQAADEFVRLSLESPAEDEDDPRPTLYVRPSGSDELWQRVYPNYPRLGVDDI